MTIIGIDVAKNKHDYCVLSSSGEIIVDHESFKNNKTGFDSFLSTLQSFGDEIKIGLEATGHYSNNLLRYLDTHGFEVVLFNPLSTNLFRKALSLRKTKTDKKDCKVIAMMLLSNQGETFTSVNHLNEDLKQLTRHRDRMRHDLAKLKVSIHRIIDIQFPELANFLPNIHQKYVYELLKKYPSPSALSRAHLTTLTKLISTSSRSKHDESRAIEIKLLAKESIGQDSDVLAFELIQVLNLASSYLEVIQEIDKQIKPLMDQINSPILSIPGISYGLGSIILAEIQDINRFDSPSKLLAFAGLDPSISQSGESNGAGKMVKRGSKYLRWALIRAAYLVAIRCPVLAEYLHKKRSEGKHFSVAITHLAKKLSRIIYYLLKNNKEFCTTKLF